MSIADKYYKTEVEKILTEGFNDEAYEVRPVWREEDGTTTPAHTIKTFCAVRRYDLSKEFPILTLRTQAFKGVVRELLWMWQKKSNVVDELGKSASIWRAWEGEDGTIGKTYGYQLGKKSKYSYGEFDQVDNLIYLLKNKPMDRRMITTMWCPEDLHEMNLPPCVYQCLFDVANGKLNCTVIQRSGDLLAAAASGGWDTMQYAILTHMLAQVCGYEVGELVHIINNLHIYDRHVEVAKEIMNNPEYPAPTLRLNPEVKDFYDFTEDDFELVNYQSTKLEKKFQVAE